MSSPLNGLYSVLSDPYYSLDSPSAVPIQRTKHRFNPYAAPHSQHASTSYQLHPAYQQEATVPVAQPTVARQSAPKRAPRPTAIAAAATGPVVYKNKNIENSSSPNEDYCFDPSAVLYVDHTLEKYQNKKNNKKQFWYFVLSLLMDTTNKNAIAWTGQGREFMISSLDELNFLWSKAQGLTYTVKLDSTLRNMRACYKRRIFVPAPGLKNNRYAFFTEPSVHANMTREQLTLFIAENCANQPRSEPMASPALYPTAPPSANYDDSSSALLNPYKPIDSPPTTHQEFESFSNQPLPVIDVDDSAFNFDSGSPASSAHFEYDSFINQPLGMNNADADSQFWNPYLQYDYDHY